MRSPFLAVLIVASTIVMPVSVLADNSLASASVEVNACPSGQQQVWARGNKEKCQVVSNGKTSLPSSSAQSAQQRPSPSVVHPSSPKGTVLIGGRPAVDREVNVGFQSGVSAQQRAAIHQTVGAVSFTSITQINLDTATLSTSGADAILAAIARYQTYPEVRFAEPNWTVAASECEDPFRPRVQASTGGGQQSVTITGTKVAEVRFTRLDNATLEVSGQSHTQAFVVSVRDASVSFIVRRAQPGVATTVSLTVVDECGSVFNTFVGGGVNAF